MASAKTENPNKAAVEIDSAGTEDNRVWRYMDFAKFVWLLSKRCLWFTRTDSFEDKWEAFCLPKVPVLPHDPSPLEEMAHAFAAHRGDVLSNLRHDVFVSCWSLSDQDSYPMWRAYTRYGHGVAIQSSTERVMKSIDEGAAVRQLRPMKSGAVEYRTEADIRAIIDAEYDCGELLLGTHWLLRPAFLKRTFYRGEYEWRAAIYDRDVKANGLAVPVNLHLLIENVYVAAVADDCFQEAVDSVLEKYGLSIRSQRSGLGSAPIIAE